MMSEKKSVSISNGVEITKDIVVIYHEYCHDGFGAAYAAWEKFGDNAQYLRANYGHPAPELTNKEVYIVDFSYPKEVLVDIESKAKKLVVLDHHISSREAVESVKEHVYSEDRSGAYLSWVYFHPDKDVPKLIEYISDADTWAHTLKDWEEIQSYIYKEDVDEENFFRWRELKDELETEEGYKKALEIGALFLKDRKKIIEIYCDKAELINFEGYEIYVVNAPGEIRSEVGNILAKKTDSFAMVISYEKGVWKCSLRSQDKVDVSRIAQKYGGGGHKNAARFNIPTRFPIDFTNLSF